MKSIGLRGMLVLAGLALAAAPAEAAAPSGQAVYEQNCAMCHAAPPAGSRAPAVALLRKLGAGALRTALTSGPMRGVGEGLSADERESVITYLAAASQAAAEPPACATAARRVDLPATLTPQGFGLDQANSRRLTRAQSGLSGADLSRLRVAWTLGLPGTSTLRSQGVVAGSTLFYAAGQAGRLYALDTKTGCARWTAKPPAEIRTSLAMGRLGAKGPIALIAGDGAGQVQAWDAISGALIWRIDPRPGAHGFLTGTAVFAGDRLIVPVSAIDVALAMRPDYACCSGHGAIVALAAATGARLWTFDTMPDAKPLGVKNSRGVEMQGPSGAPIWSSPSVDLARGLVFTGTGENTSPPATGTSDSIIAIDLQTGQTRWVFQALKNDIWNMACPVGRLTPRPPAPNCFFYGGDSVLRDHDFGAGPVLVSAGRRDLVIAGQKSGDVWGLDRATGRLIWNRKLGPGTALGGVHWGLAADGALLIVPISDPGVPDAVSAAGAHGLDALTGKILWDWRPAIDCAGERAKRIAGCAYHAGVSAAPLVIDGVALLGGLDGRLWTLNAATGAVLAKMDTARSFVSVSGLAGEGGAIDAGGIFAGDGMVFVNSGYGMFGEQPGNVLIALRPGGGEN